MLEGEGDRCGAVPVPSAVGAARVRDLAAMKDAATAAQQPRQVQAQPDIVRRNAGGHRVLREARVAQPRLGDRRTAAADHPATRGSLARAPRRITTAVSPLARRT